jgi:hypothetical protein
VKYPDSINKYVNKRKKEIMAEYNQLSDGRPDGTLIGKAASDPTGFFGATPVVQQTVTSLTTTSSTVASSVSVAVAEIQTALKNLGLCA